MIICKKCGKQNTDDSKFCIGCGEPLDDATPESVDEDIETYAIKDRKIFCIAKLIAIICLIACIAIVIAAVCVLIPNIVNLAFTTDYSPVLKHLGKVFFTLFTFFCILFILTSAYFSTARTITALVAIYRTKKLELKLNEIPAYCNIICEDKTDSNILTKLTVLMTTRQQEYSNAILFTIISLILTCCTAILLSVWSNQTFILIYITKVSATKWINTKYIVSGVAAACAILVKAIYTCIYNHSVNKKLKNFKVN